MTIEQDIGIWALTRSAWQQDVLIELSRGKAYDDQKQIAELADRVLRPTSSAPNGAAAGLTLGNAELKRVRLKCVCSVKGVNALAQDQTLSFASDGLTIVYGDNGSGKSGYARVIKAMVNARHSAKVLPDVYVDGAPDPSADLEYKADDEEHSEKFPADPPIPDLQQVRFYDEHCGDEYLSRESSVTYRPSTLVLLDGLVAVCDKVRLELQRRVAESDLHRLNLTLPQATPASAFLAKLSDKTTDEQIEQATKFSAEDADNLGKAIQEAARLETSDATKEQARLRTDAARVSRLSTILTELEDAVSESQVTAINTLKTEATTKRQAATLAASTSFDDEPIAGVGSETWRTLWKAAREYAVTTSDHEHEFPEVGDGARCVLCQQFLDDAAKDRFARFNAYMTDTTQRDAIAAEQAYTDALAAFRELDFATQESTLALASLQGHDEPAAVAVRARLGALEDRRNEILAYFTTDAAVVVKLIASELTARLDGLAASLTAQADATDVEGFKSALLAVQKTRDALEASKTLSNAATDLKTEVTRRKHINELNAARQHTDTSGITRKATELTTKYATDQIRDNFTRETERMKLQRVTLKDLGGQKGLMRQIPALLGVHHRDATARTVLSEGEQTVLGLAGFFTEAEFDASRSAVVFDDPVTSLDHVRRDKVALRLAELAKARQVIVFTHDIAFVTELLTAAGLVDVSVAARTIQHHGDVPGFCSDGFPWKAQDTPTRLNNIEVAIAKVRKGRQNLDDDAYKKRVDRIGGMLSETWERAATSEIVNQVYDRSSHHVRPEMVRMLVKITADDNKDYQDGYGRTSKWAFRHDKSEEINYVPPEPDELQSEYERLKAWHKRIKSYQQK